MGQDNEECGKMFGFTLNQSLLCGIKYSSYSSCSLDIGGSVIVTIFDDYSQDLRHYAAAVTSAGTCDKNKPILYTKVGAYSDWILSKLEK